MTCRLNKESPSLLASIIIRTYNESKYLEELLKAIQSQRSSAVDHEIIVVDSGSTDRTVNIALKFGCRIVRISKEDFTFGRSLNYGCEAASGAILVFVSGHCVPTNSSWLQELCSPLVDGHVAYTYGRQEGRDTTKYSEQLLFEKFYPAYDKVPQVGFFCNNANAALLKSEWEELQFDESLTGLEDMHLAKALVAKGKKIGYTAQSSVYHIHDENWAQVRIRYEREAYALQAIMPEVNFTLADFFRFFVSGVLSDVSRALDQRRLLSAFVEIVLFRFNHYWGTYKGSREHRQLTKRKKHDYFYPKDMDQQRYNATTQTPQQSVGDGNVSEKNL